MSSRKTEDTIAPALVTILERWTGRALAAGQAITLRVPGPGGLEVEIVATVRKQPPAPAAAAALRDQVIAYLLGTDGYGKRRLHVVRRCGCSVTSRRAGWGSSRGDCRNRVSAVVVYESGYPGLPGYVFVCGQHRAKHGIDPSRVTAIVELPDPCLAEVRRLDQVAEAAAAAERRREDEERERAALTIACPSCQAAPGVACRGGSAHYDRLRNAAARLESAIAGDQ